MLKNRRVSLPLTHKKRNETNTPIKRNVTQEGFLKTLTDRKVVWSLRCLRFSPGGAPPPNYLPPSRRPCGCRLQRPAVDAQGKHRVRATGGHWGGQCKGAARRAGEPRLCLRYIGSVLHLCFISPIENLSVCHKVLWLAEGGRRQCRGGAAEGKHVSRSGVFVSTVSGRTDVQRTETVFTATLTQFNNWPVCFLIFFCLALLCLLSQLWSDCQTNTTCTHWWKHTENLLNPSYKLIKLILN